MRPLTDHDTQHADPSMIPPDLGARARAAIDLAAGKRGQILQSRSAPDVPTLRELLDALITAAQEPGFYADSSVRDDIVARFGVLPDGHEMVGSLSTEVADIVEHVDGQQGPANFEEDDYAAGCHGACAAVLPFLVNPNN